MIRNHDSRWKQYMIITLGPQIMQPIELENDKNHKDDHTFRQTMKAQKYNVDDHKRKEPIIRNNINGTTKNNIKHIIVLFEIYGSMNKRPIIGGKYDPG